MRCLIAALFMLATACSNSKVTSSWKAPSTSKPGNKILVLGIIREKDIRLRMQMEGYLVDALKAKGYNAVSAYTLYGPKMFSNKEEEAAIGQLRNSGIDDVFTITLLDKAREHNFQPATMYPYSPFWGYYNYWYGRPYSPGYVSVDTHFFWESNLYNVSSKKLLYSVQSQTTNPSSAGSMGKDYSKAIVKNMVRLGVI
jgi:hypothetical protein